MAARVQLLSGHRAFVVEGQQTILEGGLKAGLALDYGCSDGHCGRCKARLVSGQTERVRAHDYPLTEAEKTQGYLLTCCHVPSSDIVLEAALAQGSQDIPHQMFNARLRNIERLDQGVNVLHLRAPRANRLRFLPGQSVDIIWAGGRERVPIASCPCDGVNLEFHIPRFGNAFGEYLWSVTTSGERFGIAGPHGAFTFQEARQRPMVFIASGTTFAAIKSLIEHAMNLEVEFPMHLCWLQAPSCQRYMDNLCRAWSDAWESLTYQPLRGAQALSDHLQRLPDLLGYDFYVATSAPERQSIANQLQRLGIPATQLFENQG